MAMKSKAELRGIFRARRQALSEAEIQRKSAAIREALLGYEALQGCETVLCYVSLPFEVDTRAMIDALLCENRRVLIPAVGDAGTLRWAVMRDWGSLEVGVFGILEPHPDTAEFVDPPADAPVLVPGLAFTREGFRLGYGGGYFDRFLAGHGGISLGLAFEVQIAGALPMEAHDVPVNVVVTENRVIVP